MVKIFVYAMIFILFSPLSPFLFYALGEESIPVASTKGVTIENTPPPISRNPFVSAPFGRMVKAPVKSETNPGSQRPVRIGDISKDLKVRGLLLDGDNPVALIGRRVVKIGDRFDEFTITDIKPAGITLTKGDQVIKLSVE